MFTESTAASISGRPDLESRHDLTDGVDDLPRKQKAFRHGKIAVRAKGEGQSDFSG
jgi:hypothetical protein